jgi:2,4-dienoyl-CoA reductase-like NADH-dependent reductase (Old Yellow Enzyme family)
MRAPMSATDRLFEPLEIGRLTLKNRLAVAPMTRVSADANGNPTERTKQYYRSFAEGGFGLILTEGIYTDQAHSQGYLFQPGLTDQRQAAAWSKIVDEVHARGGRIFAQLMHAGALSQGNRFRSATRAPSAMQPKGQQMTLYRGDGPYPLPVAMSHAEIAEAIQGFADAAFLAREAGFDGIEIHGANGYLLDQFLTEGVNVREDRYGGSVEGRLRLAAEVIDAVRTAVGSGLPLGVRISQAKVNDFTHKWRGGEADATTIFGLLGQLPLDYIHTTEFEAWKPAFDTGPSLAALAKRHAGIPVLANGSLHEGGRAAQMIASGQSDFISLGRGALTHHDWPRRMERGLPLEPFDKAILSPIADLANADRIRATCADRGEAAGTGNRCASAGC